ncbi:MAG: hypothetical protein MJ082_03310 [Clostridia bacterium]|nr:hypothetical protein [Clostridia bacterium]
MTEDLTFIPKPQNKNARNLTLVTMLLAFAVFIFATTDLLPRYKGVVQLVGVFLLVTSILIYVRFVSARYIYEITKDYDDAPVFVVSSRTGKRQSTLARFCLWDITAIDRETPDQTKAHAIDRAHTLLYRFLPTLGAPVVYRLSIRQGRQNIEVLIEGTEDFIAVLKNSVEEAKMIHPADDEE